MLRTALNHNPAAMAGLIAKYPRYAGVVTCEKPYSDGGLSYIDLGETVDDLIGIQMLGGFAENDMTGVEIILSSIDPSGWTAEQLQNREIDVEWKTQILIRDVQWRKRSLVDPGVGRWRYVVFFTNPDAPATGNAYLSIALLRQKNPKSGVFEATPI